VRGKIAGMAHKALAEHPLWNGEQGAGGISWVDRSQMGPIRGVIDAADGNGRRNAYMHAVHARALQGYLSSSGGFNRGLDFGCGTGRFLPLLAQYGTQVYAVDREPSMVKAAARYNGAYAQTLMCWSEGPLPFREAFFDFVLCSSVLCVTTRSLFAFSVSEMARVCRRGASLVLLEQVCNARDLTLDRYTSLLRRSGFEVTRAHPIRAGASRITKLVGKQHWIPSGAFSFLAATELAIMRRRTFARPTASYYEYMIVARRLS
jgi:SAM-dependent methyltransferase